MIKSDTTRMVSTTWSAMILNNLKWSNIFLRYPILVSLGGDGWTVSGIKRFNWFKHQGIQQITKDSFNVAKIIN